MSDIPISDIYIGLQGEGIKTGRRTIFVRVAGCNFAIDGHPCQYPCDTKYAWYPKQGKPYTMDSLIDKVANMSLVNNIKEICLTGGEPLSVPGIRGLIKYLRGYNLLVETNGSYLIWRNECAWSLDIKCPGSGNDRYNNYDNLRLLTPKDQVKFVIANREDYEFAKKVRNGYVCMTNVIFQPAWKILEPRVLAEWIIDDKFDVILGLQQHKIIWGSRRRKV